MNDSDLYVLLCLFSLLRVHSTSIAAVQIPDNCQFKENFDRLVGQPQSRSPMYDNIAAKMASARIAALLIALVLFHHCAVSSQQGRSI